MSALPPYRPSLLWAVFRRGPGRGYATRWYLCEWTLAPTREVAVALWSTMSADKSLLVYDPRTFATARREGDVQVRRVTVELA